MNKLSNLDRFRFVGWSFVIINGGQAVSGVITESYLYAGLSLGIGVVWLVLLEIRK